MVFKIIGGLLVAWGVLDIGMSYAGADIWGEWLGIDLFSISELLYKYIGYAAILGGGLIWGLGGKSDEEEEEEGNTPA